jgi:ribokinase
LAPVRVAVVGHVEWVEFLRVPRVPAAGDIVHATDVFEVAGGGGAVAAVQLRKLAGSCVFFTALGDDEVGHRAFDDLRSRGVDLEVAWRADSQRRAVTFIDEAGERTITVLGAREVPRAADPLPWGSLAEFDAVFVTGADATAMQLVRHASVVVATSRILPLLAEAGIQLDALVGSGADPSERYRPGDLDPAPCYAVMTAGARGGTIQRLGHGDETFAAAALPGPIRDAYGAGDSFAAGLTYGLGAEMEIREAVGLAARCGAHCMTGRGPYKAQLEL